MPLASRLVADKGYERAVLREWQTAPGSVPVIPQRLNRKLQYHYDKKLYRERNIIERTFNRFKEIPRIATQFDRKLKIYMAALCIVATVIWWL